MTLFLSCHFQSFQSSRAVSGQNPGACEMNSFPSPFSCVIIFNVDEKVKSLKYRVNAGTFLCATHLLVIIQLAGIPGSFEEPRQTRRLGYAIIFRRARLAPSGNRRDHGTIVQCFWSPELPDRFHCPDPQCRHRRSSCGRAPFATSPCSAGETTRDRWFPATVRL